MEPTKKNKPPKMVVAAIAILVLLIVFYFIISMVFPDLFHQMPTGDAQPVK